MTGFDLIIFAGIAFFCGGTTLLILDTITKWVNSKKNEKVKSSD